MLTGTFFDLHAAGCIQTGADVQPDPQIANVVFGPMVVALMAATSSDMCIGCPAFKGGKCKAYQKFNTRAVAHPLAKRFDRPAERCKDCGLKVRRPGHKVDGVCVVH